MSGFDLCFNAFSHNFVFVVAVTVDSWKKIADEKRNDAMHAALILLMSDFLFANVTLPDAWYHYLERLNMLKKSQISKM